MGMADSSTQQDDGVVVSTVDYMLSTDDNPWDPFTQFNEWYSWDTTHGYHTSALLARITRTSDELSDADQSVAIDLAMAEIVELNVSGKHKLVSRGEVLRTQAAST